MSNKVSDKNLQTGKSDPALSAVPTAGHTSGTGAELPNANGAHPLNIADVPRFVAPTHGGVDILKLLTELEDQVESTRKGPFNSLIGFNEDKFHTTIMKIRANLPEEMKRASKLAREQEHLVEETRKNSERIKSDSHQAALVELERSKKEAAQLREQTRLETEQLRGNANGALKEARAAAERESQHILEEAQAHCRQLVAEAHQQAKQLVDDNEILQQAQILAQDIQMRADAAAAALRHEADMESQAVRRGADDYARDVLINLEGVLNRAALQVKHGRELLEK